MFKSLEACGPTQEGEAGSFEHRLRVSSKGHSVDIRIEELGYVLGPVCSKTVPKTLRWQGDGCLVESTVEYEPSAPLQTLLNAFGGPRVLKTSRVQSAARRKSQQSGHMQVLRRLGGLVDAWLQAHHRAAEDGDQVFDPVAFYDLIGASFAIAPWLR